MITAPLSIAPQVFPFLRNLTADGSPSIAAAVSTAWTDLATYRVLDDERGYLTGVGITVRDALGVPYDWNGSIAFRLLVGNGAVRNWDTYTGQRGSVLSPAPIIARLEPGVTTVIQARRVVAGAAANTVSALLIGMLWPKDQERAPSDQAPGSGCLTVSNQHLARF